MASIKKFKRDSGVVYRVSWRVGAGPNRRSETKTFDSMEGAKAHRREVEKMIEARRVGSTSRVSLFEYLDQWLAEKADDRTNPVTASTIEAYTAAIERAKRGFQSDLPLSQVDAARLEAAYKKLLTDGGRKQGGGTKPMSRAVVLSIHGVLHNALREAMRKKLIAENPAALARAPRAAGKKWKTNVRAFTKDEVARMLTLAQEGYSGSATGLTYAMAATLLATGLRRGELLGLADDAIDWEKGIISIYRNVISVNDKVVVTDTKTDAGTRKMHIAPELLAILRSRRLRVMEKALAWGKGYQREPLYLFPGVAGAPMHPHLVTERLRRLVKLAGIEAGPGMKISPVHSWRHTTGTLVMASSGNIKTVMTRLGHTTADMAHRYVDALVEADVEAAHHLGALLR